MIICANCSRPLTKAAGELWLDDQQLIPGVCSRAREFEHVPVSVPASLEREVLEEWLST